MKTKNKFYFFPDREALEIINDLDSDFFMCDVSIGGHDHEAPTGHIAYKSYVDGGGRISLFTQGEEICIEIDCENREDGINKIYELFKKQRHEIRP